MGALVSVPKEYENRRACLPFNFHVHFLKMDINPLANIYLFIKTLSVIRQSIDASRGLFCDEPRHSELRSDDEDDAGAGAPSPSFRTTPSRGRLATAYVLACNSGSS
ncbi:hypothetical protein AVEN_229574-1 [Araneus ventricosus]|uniref:Uncharacterized protein n=1 Tax=Araneus ventricosus TaxID=182803 RepID=A0A4Y2GHV2_ARAVE|nr:hypothetical protein AVEN_229574-1 [Araneus ventricosus]